jgi:phosphoenolpyruvate carboxykinase (ATP)
MSVSSVSQLVRAKNIIANPDPADLKKLVGEMPNARLSKYGSYNVETQVVARSKGSTYVVTDHPEEHTDQTITRAAGDKIARLQDDYMAGREMIQIDGFIGPDPSARTATRLIMERQNANIAAMQQQLYFTPPTNELAHFEPALHVIYTPNLAADGYPQNRIIAVDLTNNVTRVLNSDYFGESKKGGLRMWNKLVYDKGGLPLHAGCKSIPVDGKARIGLVVGLSGTGKTTTTFTRQNDSRPIQDDFVAMFSDGRIHATENGCFAKTYGLEPSSEPIIHRAVTQPEAYLENVSMDKTGNLDFSDDGYTQNGRATFSFDLVKDVGNLRDIPRADFLLILNRNENIIPAVARLSGAQAAAYFMLGETKGTSAGGAEEAGKALRVPGTNPFFPLLHGYQGTRFLELMQRAPLEVYLMNTGWVGGASDNPDSQKVKIRHSSAIVKAIAEGTIDWTRDEDFGYEIAARVPELAGEDDNVLRPKEYYRSLGRIEEYKHIVEKLKTDRRAHLAKYPGLKCEIIDSVS